MGDSLFWPGGGSGSGGTLAVTAPVGTTVIATNEALGKTISKAVNAEGIAVLKGLKTGTWLLSCTDGSITSTPVPVVITADYTKTLAFFSATINVTYPVGSTVTCTCGTVQLVSTQVEDANGSATFVVPNAGTWTVTATANDGSGNSKSQSVSITKEGQLESVELSYAYVIFDEVSGLTPGFASGGAAEILFGEDSGGKYFEASAGGGYNRMAYFTPEIDLTEYNTLEFYGYSVGTAKFIGVWSGVPQPESKNPVKASVVVPKGTEPSTVTLDISSFSGEYYIGFQYATSDVVGRRLILK